MIVEFIRFKASDNVELLGWLSTADSDTAIIHIHGMSGNGYENCFLDNLRESYTKRAISFFSIDTRGRGVISSFWKGKKTDSIVKDRIKAGSCFEIFGDCVYDIQGAINFLKLRGKKRFILQGHSLGASKVMHFLVTQNIPDIIAAILLAPTDMVEWAKTDSHHKKYLAKAKRLNSLGKSEELVDAECWLDKTPISAQTYPTICEAGSAVDIYGLRDNGSLLGRIKIPMLITCGDKDIGVLKTDGSIKKWYQRTSEIINAETEIAIIKGAPHNFKCYEKNLVAKIDEFIELYICD